MARSGVERGAGASLLRVHRPPSWHTGFNALLSQQLRSNENAELFVFDTGLGTRKGNKTRKKSGHDPDIGSLYHRRVSHQTNPTRMRLPSVFLLASLLLSGIASAASAGDAIRYLACRADNEDAPSLIAIDETTHKVCDRDFAPGWITPMTFDQTTVEWSDGAASLKSIVRSRKGIRYEHDSLFIVVHIGHCSKVKAPTAPICNG